MPCWMLKIADEPELRLESTSVTVGRDDDCDVPITEEHPSVSRRHARLEPHSDGVLVTDLESRNGTRVNGARISAPTLARHNDEIQFGHVRATLWESGKTEVWDAVPRGATQYMDVVVPQSAAVGAPVEEPRPASPGARPALTGVWLMGVGAVLLLIGVVGWLNCSSQMADAQGAAGQIVRLLDESARARYSGLQTALSLFAGAGVVGLIALLIGLVNYARRS